MRRALWKHPHRSRIRRWMGRPGLWDPECRVCVLGLLQARAQTAAVARTEQEARRLTTDALRELLMGSWGPQDWAQGPEGAVFTRKPREGDTRA